MVRIRDDAFAVEFELDPFTGDEELDVCWLADCSKRSCRR